MDYTYISPKLELRKSKIEGKGIFAKENIGKDEIMIIWGGQIIELKEYLNFTVKDIWKDKNKVNWHYFIQIEEDFAIGPGSEAEIREGYMVNHSCEPNSYICGQISLKAMGNIKSGTEITFDYATMFYLPDDMINTIECSCGSKNCRGAITTSDWKKEELRKKYKGKFTKYLQKKIIAGVG